MLLDSKSQFSAMVAQAGPAEEECLRKMVDALENSGQISNKMVSRDQDAIIDSKETDPLIC